MNIFGFQMAVKNFLKRNTINFLNYALILRRSVVIYDMCIVMWNFTIRDGKIVQRAEVELDNPSSIVTTHYLRYRTTFYLHS
jgi:hypothetical protein